MKKQIIAAVLVLLAVAGMVYADGMGTGLGLGLGSGGVTVGPQGGDKYLVSGTDPYVVVGGDYYTVP